jgi:non-heme Fe2+,alpha-ketoglutarate-dependent halogenase
MIDTSKNHLSREQVERYERDGALFPVPALSHVEASEFRAAFEETESHAGGNLGNAPLTHLYFRWAYDLATRPAILDAVESIIGADILVQGSLLLCKYPRDPARVLWHQDRKYSNQNGSPTTSAWIALGDSTTANGCLRVIPGSHLRGILPHAARGADDNLLNYDGVAEVDETRALDVVLKAGEMSLHQGDLVHGSEPNDSDAKRVGFVVRYVTPDFEQAVNPVVRARGRGECRHLTFLREPPRGGVAESVAPWEAYLRRRNLAR